MEKSLFQGELVRNDMESYSLLDTDDILCGQAVRLVALEPEAMASSYAGWARDSEYMRLEDAMPSPLWSHKKIKAWAERDLDKDALTQAMFMIRTLDGDHLIGFVGLDGFRWPHGEAFVGIGIGPREFWDRGYGTDAMRVILRYAFNELNLHRVSLDVFEYNPRAIRCYEKAGFREEGRVRKYLHRDGRRWDLIYMGILRQEWEQLQPQRE